MPALDKFHSAVRHALEKDGWTITHDPLTLNFGGERLFIDLGAEQIIAAEKGTRKIAVEIKTFAGLSKVSDLQDAIGQCVICRVALRRLQPDRVLYLAVPEAVLQELFQNRELWQATVTDENIRLFGYDAITEEVVQWFPTTN
ncbi:MAG: XisH family protein [Armatimonadetes bacterium]|nr:XisH family protein [Armatimonadota bacterium]